MQSNSADAYSLIQTGFYIRALLYTTSTECRYVVDNIAKLMRQLENSRFNYAEPELKATKATIEELIRSNGEKTKPPEDVATRLRIVVDSVHALVRAQAQARKLLEMDNAAVPTKLQDYVASKALSKVQTLLVSETIQGLETGAYRSAIVMGWNLVYDRIREWVFSDATRLAAFNAEMARIQKRGSPAYSPIQKYSDFFDGPSEAQVIDLCEDAKIVGGKIHDDLRTWLRRRNEYAHASDKAPTRSQACALLEHFIDILVELGI